MDFTVVDDTCFDGSDEVSLLKSKYNKRKKKGKKYTHS